MQIQIYTDDGYHQVDIELFSDQFDTLKLVEMLYDKKVLSADDVNTLLPTGYEVVVPPMEPSREQRAQELLREMYMKCRDSQRVNQHNPYTWAELNTDLMNRLKEFM